MDAQTRPELFRDTPPDRAPTASAPAAPIETAATFWVTMLIRTALVLGAVVGLAYLILGKGLARLVRPKLTGSMRLVSLVERLPLGPKHALYLVEADGRRFLVGTAEHTTSLVAELTSTRSAMQEKS